MDIDEYDYLEKTFETHNSQEVKEVNNDSEEIIKLREEVHSHSLDHNNDTNESRIRDKNRDSQEMVKSGEEFRSRSMDHKSDDDDYDHDGHSNWVNYSNNARIRDANREEVRSRSPDHNSKRVKYENESRIRYSNRGIESSRHKDGDTKRRRGSAEHRDRERDRDRRRDREDAYGRDRERERHRHKGREQEWDRERGRERRGREHDGERDSTLYREREHSRRSGTPLKSYQDRDETETIKGKECKQTDKGPVEGDKECSRAKEDGTSLEVDFLPCNRTMDERADLEAVFLSRSRKKDRVDLEADLECDRRTVYAYEISLKADKNDVYEFFLKAGKVQDVRLIMDSNLGKSEGIWCIEFCDTVSVPMAIELSGQSLHGQPVMVKPSKSENNLVQSTTAAADTAGLTSPHSEGPGRLYVGNLHVNIREDQLRQVFEPFGEVELVRLSMDRNEHCRGFGFVQFARLQDARNAQTLDDNLEIAGRIIKVSAVTDQNRTLDVGTNSADVHDEGDALSLNAHSLETLLQKLDRDGTISSIFDILNTPIVNSIGAPNIGTASFVSAQTLAKNSVIAPAVLLGTSIQVPAVAIPSIDTIGTPSECLLLENIFDPKLETDPVFFLDVRKDVKEECSRFGNLKHIFVEKKSAGLVYIRFDNIKSAISAQHALHGRWFSGNMVTATFVDPQSYETKFPRSR